MTSKESVNFVTLIQYVHKFRLWVEWGETITKPVGFPETSVTNYQSTLHDIPRDQKSQGVVVCLKGAAIQ